MDTIPLPRDTHDYIWRRFRIDPKSRQASWNSNLGRWCPTVDAFDNYHRGLSGYSFIKLSKREADDLQDDTFARSLQEIVADVSDNPIAMSEGKVYCVFSVACKDIFVLDPRVQVHHKVSLSDKNKLRGEAHLDIWLTFPHNKGLSREVYEKIGIWLTKGYCVPLHVNQPSTPVQAIPKPSPPVNRPSHVLDYIKNIKKTT